MQHLNSFTARRLFFVFKGSRLQLNTDSFISTLVTPAIFPCSYLSLNYLYYTFSELVSHEPPRPIFVKSNCLCPCQGDRFYNLVFRVVSQKQVEDRQSFSIPVSYWTTPKIWDTNSICACTSPLSMPWTCTSAKHIDCLHTSQLSLGAIKGSKAHSRFCQSRRCFGDLARLGCSNTSLVLVV